MSNYKNSDKSDSIRVKAYLSQQKVKNLNKDSMIKKLQKEISFLSKEIIRLKADNADLRSRVSLMYSMEQNYKSAQETINEIRDQTNKIISNKDDEHKKLKLKIEQMELEKTLDDLKNNRNMTLYNQKMSVVHHIEMENKVYKDEVNELKKKNEQLNKATKTKLESLEILNQIKFSQFKKKMIDNLKEAKNNVSKLNMEYMDLNGKIIILQNHQLLSELEFQKDQIDNLDKENLKLKKKIFDLEKEIAIHKNVEIKLAIKAKNNNINNNINNNELNTFKKDNHFVEELNSNNYDIIMNSNDIILQPVKNKNSKSLNSRTLINKEKINDILNNNLMNENTNKGEKTISKSSTLYNQKFKIDSGNNNIYTYFPSDRNRISKIDFKYIKYNKIIKKKNDEIERLNIALDHLKNKIDKYIGNNKSLFSFLEESINTFFKECKEMVKEKNIKIDYEKLIKFDFESLNNEEKYSILILLMKFLLPLVTFNYNINNVRENIFKTNLNINIINRNLSYSSAEKYTKDSFFKNAFFGKKINNNLFNDINSVHNYGKGNIIPGLKKTDFFNDSKMKVNNNKFKSIIK